MKEKQKIHYSVWKRFVDGIYTCKDIEELLADKKTDRSKDFDEASACLYKISEGKTVMSIDSSSVSLQLQRLMMEKRMSIYFFIVLFLVNVRNNRIIP